MGKNETKNDEKKERIVCIQLHDPDLNTDIFEYVITSISSEEINKIFSEAVKEWLNKGEINHNNEEIDYGEIPSYVANKIGKLIKMETYRRDI